MGCSFLPVGVRHSCLVNDKRRAEVWDSWTFAYLFTTREFLGRLVRAFLSNIILRPVLRQLFLGWERGEMARHQIKYFSQSSRTLSDSGHAAHFR
jgi:hypothetical protein